MICGSYDCRLSWFDLDLSTKPYKMLRWGSAALLSVGRVTVFILTPISPFSSLCRHHKKAVRGVAYHRTYPLLASASDDGSVIVCHGTVYK